MSEINDGGPFFPLLVNATKAGATLRDIFALVIAHGMQVNGRVWSATPEGFEKWTLEAKANWKQKRSSYSSLAAEAYETADAMIAAREKGPDCGGEK